MRFLFTLTRPCAFRQSCWNLRKLLLAACSLALPLNLHAQGVSFAGLQTILPATTTITAPVAVAIDAAGNRYILNHQAATVTKVNAAGTSSTTITVNPALSDPRAVALDSIGNLYVADYTKTSIVKIPAAGGTATNVGLSLSHPTGVAIDSSDDVYIADSGNARIVKVVGSKPQTVVAVPTGTFTTPTGIAVDPYGNVYVSDTGNHSLIFINYPTPTMLSATPVLTNLTNAPAYVAVDTSSDVILSGGTDHAVTFYQVPKQLKANGTIRQLGNDLSQPEGLTIDASSNVYVADQTAPAIAIIAPGSINLGEVNLCPVAGTQTAPCTSTATLRFNVASGESLTSASARVVTEGAPNLDFTATNNTCIGTLTGPTSCSVTVQFQPVAPGVRLGAVDISGVAGTATTSSLLASVSLQGLGLGSLPGFDAGRISSLPLTLGSSPYLGSVIADRAGNLYFVDNSNCVIEKFVPPSGPTTIIAGTGTCGPAAGDGGPATGATFTEPWRLALSPRGDLYVSDDKASVIRKIDGQTGIISTVAGTLNTSNYSNDETVASLATLSSPFGLAFDAAGDLYFSDWAEHTVRKIDALSGVLTTVAGKYTLGCGTNGADGDGGSAPFATLNNPLGIAIDANNVLYIADGSSHLVRKVDPSSGNISTVAGVLTDAPACDTPATGSYSGDGGLATSAHLNAPEGLAVDPANNLYIADTNNLVVRKVNAATGNITTVGGVYTGSAQNSGDGGAANLAGLGNVQDVAADSSGNFYIADSSNSLVREVMQASGEVDLATFDIGASSPAIDVALTNNGNTPLALSALTAPTSFNSSGSDTTCTASAILAVGQSCLLGVEFDPTAAGPLTGSLTVTDNQGGNLTATQSIALSGTGAYLATQLVLSGIPASLNAGSSLGTAIVKIEGANNVVITTSSAPVKLNITGPGYAQTQTVSASSGVATFNLSSLPLTAPGTYTVTASSASLPASSAIVSVTPPPATQIAVHGLPATIAAGGNLGMVTATLEDATGAVITSSTAPVTATITGPGSALQPITATAAGGVATLDLSSVALATAGNYTIAITSGSASASSTVTVTLIVSISGSSSSTIQPGGAATFSISLAATSATYAQPVSFTASGMPAGATASFSPATLTPGSAAVTTTFTIQTAAASAKLHELQRFSSGWSGLALGMLLLPLAASRRLRRAASQLPLLAILFISVSIGAVCGLAGCGASAGKASTPAPQSYTIMVTGTTGEAKGSTTVTLTVQ